MAFHPIGFAVEQQGGKNKLTEMEDCLYGYSSYAIDEGLVWFSQTFSTNERKLKIRASHKVV